MANIFKRKSVTEKLESDLAGMRKRVEALALKRADAKSSFDVAVSERQRHLLEGDLSDEKAGERLQRAVDASASRLNGYDSALLALQAQVDDAEARLRAEVESVERDRTASEIETVIDEIKSRIAPWLENTRDMVARLAAVDHISVEVSQCSGYLSRVAGEIELALAVALPSLSAHATMIRSGDMRTPRFPKPEPEVLEMQANVPTPTSVGEPTEQVWATKPLKWRGLDGQQVFVSRWDDTMLPTRLLARAQSRQAVAPLDDPRRRDHKGLLSGITTTPPSAYVDLDASGLAPASVTGLPPGFEPLPGLARPRTLSVAVTPARGTDEAPA
jgi:hypothetical protein